MQMRTVESFGSLLPKSLKRAVFRLIEGISESRAHVDAHPLSIFGPDDAPHPSGPFIWIYAATLGELNLSATFIDRLIDRYRNAALLLITDRDLYASPYRQRYPKAVVATTDGRASHARELVRRFPPKALIISEIPCWPGDAPCRLSYALLSEIERSGAPIALINAWIYDYPPSSRIVQLERAFFRADFLRAMTLITTQTDSVKARLAHEGAHEERVHVTGNMKFDILGKGVSELSDEGMDATLRGLIDSPRPCLVAGCVGKVEQQPLISAFATIRETHPNARIIIALRHPENPDHVENLIRLLDDAGISWIRRSEHGTKVVADRCDCLILDTFGELARFYAAGKVAYVGRDHNVLEPMARGAKVTVLSGWKTVFPSYPVYQLLRDRGLLEEADNAAELAGIWIRELAGSREIGPASLMSTELQTLTGATERNLQLVLDMLDSQPCTH